MSAVILIIEDDPGIQELLAFTMAQEGWRLLQADTGERGLEFLKSETADCILLDIMLPGIDGLKVLRKIKEKEKNRAIPIIMTSARGEEADIVTGLELGADDYVVKPYSPKVLIARVRAALRRQENRSGEEFADGPLVCDKLALDDTRHEARYDGKPLELAATEFAMLRHFLLHPDRVFSRNQIIAAIKGPDHPVTDRSVDVQILGLRKKLGEAGAMIETIRGVGYRFKAEE
ncbi:MAG: phosphate regulon transcriptional regulator PhoB [Treponemataceae bacterium]|nr:MAG: phosphate regulon transcriptional regulator PhoB [Treponemataceae bacterium]